MFRNHKKFNVQIIILHITNKQALEYVSWDIKTYVFMYIWIDQDSFMPFNEH